MPVTRELNENERTILKMRDESGLRLTDVILRLQADTIDLPRWNEDPTREETLKSQLYQIAINAIATIRDLESR